MKISELDNKILKLEKENEKYKTKIDENNRKLEEFKQKKELMELDELKKILSSRSMSLDSLKKKIINNELSEPSSDK